MKIGVMGARGSFSEQAGEMYVTREALIGVEIVPLVSAEGVLGELEAGSIDKGIFPVMNNNGGIVIEAMHAMAAHRFLIETMFEMDVHHMLLVREGVQPEDITTIVSHDQAIKQCRGYLDRDWAHTDVLPYKDTAQAAADLASGVLSRTTAVIAPRRSAELYGLTVLVPSIQDNVHNKTTFVVALPITK
jgi:prephenate dehydratase